LIEDSGDNATLFDTLVDVGSAGSGSETGLTAAAFALCKAQNSTFWDSLGERPADDPIRLLCGRVPEADRMCNESFARPGAVTAVIVVSNEGDETYRSGENPPGAALQACIEANNGDPNFGECDCRISWWMEFFAGIGPDVRFFNIGPTYQGSPAVDLCGVDYQLKGPCNPFGSDPCSIDFYQQSACLSGGEFFPVARATNNDPGSCTTPDFTDIADSIATALGG
jgi:hypothetical protein